MGLLNWFGNRAGAVAMQAGSDVLIGRHTGVDPLSLPAGWRESTNEFLKRRFLETGDIHSEFDAALLKLAVYWILADRAEDRLLRSHVGLGISSLRDAGAGQISPAISLEVMGQTGS